MTTLEFIQKKNAIIEKHCGVTLIPADQMVDYLPKMQLSLEADRYACPYCMMFLKGGCKECPMFKAGNDCHESHSTYSQMCDIIGDKDMVGDTTPWHNELRDLILTYNNS